MNIYVTTRALRSTQVTTGSRRGSLGDLAGAQNTMSCDIHGWPQDRARRVAQPQEAMTAALDEHSQVENLCWWAR